MQKPAKRSTIYFDPELHAALRIKAVETNTSLSALVNEAVRQVILEDMEDLDALEKKASEPTVSYQAMLKKLKKDGTI